MQIHFVTSMKREMSRQKTQQKTLWHGTFARIVIIYVLPPFNLNVQSGKIPSFGF
jgi:hypothetical protein